MPMLVSRRACGAMRMAVRPRAPIFGRLSEPSQASAADLKFLHRVPRVRLRNFKSKSGTRIIELLVPFGFRSSYSSVPRCITNFENRALVARLELRRRNSSFSCARTERPLSHDVPIGATQVSLAQLNERSRDIFRQIVESYLATGEPVGSRNISRLITTPLSPASVRNVMSDLEQLGLIYAPHTSAGRLPTELGLRFFVDALMEIGDLAESDRREMEAKVAAVGKSMDAVLNEASGMLSELARAAGVVLTAKSNVRLKHIEFVRLEPESALAILVADDGQVENRIINVPMGLPASSLTEAANFLNAHVRGCTLVEAKAELEK